MIKNKKLLLVLIPIACLLVFSILFYSCNKNEGAEANGTKTDLDEALASVDTSFKDNDLDASYSEAAATKIIFSGDAVDIDGVGASASGADVTVTGSGTFIISGKTADGSLTVDCGKGNEARIVLSGLDITNADGPAVYIKSGKKITFTLAEGSVNVISDGESYSVTDSDSTLDGAIFSKSDLVFNGTGELTVNGNNAHGIVSKDKLTIVEGKYTVSSAGAGICGKDCIKISCADITVNAGSDALRSDNETDAGAGYIYIKDGNFNITAYNDGLQAFSVVSIDGGTFDITTAATSSSESAKGIKGGTGVSVKGGTFVIDSEDDSLHSDGDISVLGGDFTINSGDDGIHANDTLEITNGNIIIESSYEGIEGTDIYVSGGYIEINSSDDGMNASGGNDGNTGVVGRPGGDMFEAANGSITVSGGYIIIHNEGDGVDSNGSLEVTGGVILVDGPSTGGNGSFDYASDAKITGGVVITLGVSDMAQNFTEATQGSILVSSSGSFPAGSVLSICDEEGNVILAFTSTKAFSGALFSAPELKVGSTYTFYVDADVEGLDQNGYAHNTSQTGGESCGSVTLDDYICGQGSGMGGGMGGGGRPGGRPW